MSTMFNIILLIILGVAAFFVIRRIRGYKKPEHIVPKDPASQAAYDKKKHKEDEEKTLTLQEKIELSWQFLTNIAEQVINRFSPEDKRTVQEAGDKLSKNGMKYEHNRYLSY